MADLEKTATSSYPEVATALGQDDAEAVVAQFDQARRRYFDELIGPTKEAPNRHYRFWDAIRKNTPRDPNIETRTFRTPFEHSSQATIQRIERENEELAKQKIKLIMDNRAIVKSSWMSFDFGGQTDPSEGEMRQRVDDVQQNKFLKAWFANKPDDDFASFHVGGNPRSFPDGERSRYGNDTYGKNQSTAINQKADTPKDFWKVAVSFARPPGQADAGRVLEIASQIEPKRQTSDLQIYRDLRKALLTIQTEMSRRDQRLVPRLANMEVPDVNVLYALQLYGVSDGGFGVTPSQIDMLLWSTALVWLVVDLDKRRLPVVWQAFAITQVYETPAGRDQGGIKRAKWREIFAKAKIDLAQVVKFMWKTDKEYRLSANIQKQFGTDGKGKKMLGAAAPTPKTTKATTAKTTSSQSKSAKDKGKAVKTKTDEVVSEGVENDGDPDTSSSEPDTDSSEETGSDSDDDSPGESNTKGKDEEALDDYRKWIAQGKEVTKAVIRQANVDEATKLPAGFWEDGPEALRARYDYIAQDLTQNLTRLIPVKQEEETVESFVARSNKHWQQVLVSSINGMTLQLINPLYQQNLAMGESLRAMTRYLQLMPAALSMKINAIVDHEKDERVDGPSLTSMLLRSEDFMEALEGWAKEHDTAKASSMTRTVLRSDDFTRALNQWADKREADKPKSLEDLIGTPQQQQDTDKSRRSTDKLKSNTKARGSKSGKTTKTKRSPDDDNLFPDIIATFPDGTIMGDKGTPIVPDTKKRRSSLFESAQRKKRKIIADSPSESDVEDTDDSGEVSPSTARQIRRLQQQSKERRQARPTTAKGRKTKAASFKTRS